MYLKKTVILLFFSFFNPKIPIPSLQLHQLSCLYIHLFSQQTPKGVHIKKKTYSRCIWVCVSERERMEDKRTHELPELYAPNGGEGPYSYSQNSNYQVFFNI